MSDTPNATFAELQTATAAAERTFTAACAAADVARTARRQAGHNPATSQAFTTARSVRYAAMMAHHDARITERLAAGYGAA